jgi:chorismate-pyruvate lyase
MMDKDKHRLNENLENKLKQLPKILQIILNTEGTVTDILSTWIGKKVNVKKLVEKKGIIYKNTDLNPYSFDTDTLLDERIILINDYNNYSLLMAVSAVYLEYLPDYLKEKLRNTNIGIGKLLLVEKMSAFREIEKVELLPISDVENFSTCFPEEKIACIHRSYNIYLGMKLTKKIYTVNEYWPASIKL